MHTLQFQQMLHQSATWYMVGVIWIIQLVHYPLFKYLDRSSFSSSHSVHMRGISWVVAPAMLIELGSAVSILWSRGLAHFPSLAGFVLLLVIWSITFFKMVPLHDRLQTEGFQAALHEALLLWNWSRTLSWTARGVIVAVYL